MTKLKKKPFQPKLRTIEDKLWALCRQLTFLVFGTDCYTCPQKNLQGANLQCGHAYPKGALGAMMKYDLRILRAQCYNCNINYGGMGAIFWKNLERDLGKDKSDSLFLECQSSKGKTTNARDYYTELIVTYKKELQLRI